VNIWRNTQLRIWLVVLAALAVGMGVALWANAERSARNHERVCQDILDTYQRNGLDYTDGDCADVQAP
jgi:hypothetical protein